MWRFHVAFKWSRSALKRSLHLIAYLKQLSDPVTWKPPGSDGQPASRATTAHEHIQHDFDRCAKKTPGTSVPDVPAAAAATSAQIGRLDLDEGESHPVVDGRLEHETVRGRHRQNDVDDRWWRWRSSCVATVQGRRRLSRVRSDARDQRGRGQYRRLTAVWWIKDNIYTRGLLSIRCFGNS